MADPALSSAQAQQEPATSPAVIALEQALADARCVPFLGAGISFLAETDGLPDWGRRHRIDVMCRLLAAAIGPAAIATYEQARIPAKTREVFAALLTPSALAAIAPQLATATTADAVTLLRSTLGPLAAHRLSDLCECFLSSGDPDRDWPALIRLLGIDQYDRLRPTRAHVALAHLALEGHLEEVVTSNYDACLERAFLAASGCATDRHAATDELGRSELDRALDACRPGAAGDAQLAVVHDRDSYARLGAEPSDVAPTPQRPGGRRLRIVKINGDCLGLRRSGSDAVRCDDAAAARRIILTETQLQDWRERQWARDLFRDRLRCRRIVFSGFGSAEPQVLHQLHQIVEEWQQGDALLRPASSAQRPVPLFCLFESPAPVHLQQFRAVVASHADDLDPLITPKVAVDARLIPAVPAPGEAKLSADALWQALWRRQAQRRLRAALRGAEGACDRLRALLPSCWQLEAETAQAIECAAEHVTAAQTPRDVPAGKSVLECWCEDDGTAVATGPLGRGQVPRLHAALAALHRDRQVATQLYRPLRREAGLAVELLIVLRLLHAVRAPAATLCSHVGLRRMGAGLGVPLRDGRFVVLAAGETDARVVSDPGDPAPEQIALLLLLGAQRMRQHGAQLVPVQRRGAQRTDLPLVRVPRLTLAELWAVAPEDSLSAETVLHRALIAPRQIVRSLDRSAWRRQLRSAS